MAVRGAHAVDVPERKYVKTCVSWRLEGGGKPLKTLQHTTHDRIFHLIIYSPGEGGALLGVPGGDVDVLDLEVDGGADLCLGCEEEEDNWSGFV